MATSSRRKPEAFRKRPKRAAGAGRALAQERRPLPAPEAPPPPDERQQSELFDRAMALFHSGDYVAARGVFAKAAAGPVLAMAHSAQLHITMCARRVSPAHQPSLETPEEHYDYAIALINERRIAEAERHLAEALNRAPNADHVHYALALCHGLAGDLRGAYRHLRRAIEIQPRNRVTARNDADFAAIAQLSPLFELLYPERAASVPAPH